MIDMLENCDDCEKELAKCRETVSKAKEEKLNSCEKEKKQEVEKNKKLQKQLMRWTIGAAVASAVLGKELVDKITDAFSSAEKAVQTINPNSFMDNLNYGNSDSEDKKEDKKEDKQEEKEEKEEDKDKDEDEVSFIPIIPNREKIEYANAGGWGLLDYTDFISGYSSNNYLGIKDITNDLVLSTDISDMIRLSNFNTEPFDMNYPNFNFQDSRLYLQASPPVSVPSPGSLGVFLIHSCLGSRRRRF